MPDPWHRPDTLAKYELLKKTMNEKGMDVAVRFLRKKQIILDPHAELTDEIERTLLFYQVKAVILQLSGESCRAHLSLAHPPPAAQAHNDLVSGRLPCLEQEARLFAATKCQFELGDYDPQRSIEDMLYATLDSPPHVSAKR